MKLASSLAATPARLVSSVVATKHPEDFRAWKKWFQSLVGFAIAPGAKGDATFAELCRELDAAYVDYIDRFAEDFARTADEEDVLGYMPVPYSVLWNLGGVDARLCGWGVYDIEQKFVVNFQGIPMPLLFETIGAAKGCAKAMYQTKYDVRLLSLYGGHTGQGVLVR